MRIKPILLCTIAFLSIFGTLIGNAALPNEVRFAGSADVNTISPLRSEGRYLLNSNGQIVRLRGVNQEGFLDSANGWWNPQGGDYFSGLNVWNENAVKYNLDCMKNWSCNVIRLTIKISWWLDDTDNYRQHIKDTIRRASERGIYTILTPYCIIGRSGDYLPFPPYGTTTQEQTYISNSSAFVKYWMGMAQELKSFAGVLFEVFNEPYYTGAESTWFGVVQQCIDAIRDTGANQPIIVQWGYCSLNVLYWIQNFTLDGTNIVFSTHIYRWHGSFDGSYASPTNYTYISTKMDEIRQVAETLNKTILIGETGANMYWGDPRYPPQYLKDELEYFNNTLAILNQWKVGYVVWVWTVTAHMAFGVLQNDFWCPPPNEAGQIFINNTKTD